MVLRPLHMPSASDAVLPFRQRPGNAAIVSWLQVSFLQLVGPYVPRQVTRVNQMIVRAS